MSFYFPNIDPVYVYKRKGDENDPFIFLQEQSKTIVNNKIILKEIPDFQSNVIVKNSSDVELTKTTNETIQPNEFRIDYSVGHVYFHSSLEGQNVTLEYTGTGYVSFPAERIWIETTGETAEKTLQDMVVDTESQSQYAKEQGDYAKEQGNLAKTQNDIANTIVNDTKYREPYNATTTYNKNNIVSFNGSSYIAKRTTTGNSPTDDPNDLNWGIVGRKGADGTGTVHVHKDEFEATENQKVFTLTHPYDQFQNRTDVKVGGVPQKTPENYEETSSTTITLSEGVPAGTIIEVKYFSESIPLQSDIQTTVDNHSGIISSHAVKLNNHDTELTSVASQLAETPTQSDLEYKDVKNQVDYVADLQRLSSAKREMSIEKLASATQRFKVNIPLSDNDGIAYYFQKNASDNFWMSQEGVYGSISRSLRLADKLNYSDSYLGTVLNTDYGNNPPNYWTNVVGAYIKADNLYGTKITYLHYADYRGGLVEFTLDEGTPYEQKKTISLYSDPAVSLKEQILFENLDLKSHTIKGVFLGVDAENPIPSGKPRMWMYFGGQRTQDTSRTFHVYRDSFTVNPDVKALYGSSNKEFAVQLRPVGSTESYNYIPAHNGIGTAFEKTPTKILIDGKEVDLNTLGYAEGFRTMQLIQRHYGYHSSDLINPFCEIYCQSTVKDGVLSYNGRIKFLKDADVASISSILTAYYVAFVKKIKSNSGNVYATKTDGSLEYWAESDKFKSLILFNDVATDISADVALAMTVDNLDRTYRYGLEGRGNPYSWIEHRDINIGKVYNRPVKDYLISAGFEYRFDGRFIVTKIPGLRDYIL